MTQITLKTCPFCKSQAQFVQTDVYWVRCTNDENCAAETGAGADGTMEQAAAIWNRRDEGEDIVVITDQEFCLVGSDKYFAKLTHRSCFGCAGQMNGDLCAKLDVCSADLRNDNLNIIWVEAE